MNKNELLEGPPLSAIPFSFVPLAKDCYAKQFAQEAANPDSLLVLASPSEHSVLVIRTNVLQCSFRSVLHLFMRFNHICGYPSCYEEDARRLHYSRDLGGEPGDDDYEFGYRAFVPFSFKEDVVGSTFFLSSGFVDAGLKPWVEKLITGQISRIPAPVWRKAEDFLQTNPELIPVHFYDPDTDVEDDGYCPGDDFDW